jgi:hypothetical protein
MLGARLSSSLSKNDIIITLKLEKAIELVKMTTTKYSSFKELAKAYDCFLFDCDGVLFHGPHTIQGSF